MQKHHGLKLGTTLYSLTTEFHNLDYSFAQLVRKVAAEGLGPGLEVVGFQSIKGFPEVTGAFADAFGLLIEETGLELSCLGINADVAIDRGRDLDQDELVAYHEKQLHAAAKLGFPLVRYQYGAGPAVIERLVPLAERLGIKLGLEIHAPHHVQHPVILGYREMYARAGSACLGFIPDFGASARAVPPSFIDYARDLGASESLIGLALKHWECGSKPRIGASDDDDVMGPMMVFANEALAHGEEERIVVELFPIFGLFSCQPPEDWNEIMDQVVHIHGKFFDFDDNGDEVSVDFERTLPVFLKGGFNGFMSSEYEGHHWCDADGFAKLRQHHVLASRIIAEASE